LRSGFVIPDKVKSLGWTFSQSAKKDCVEVEMPVIGMPKELGSGKGFVDYVFWGKDGVPLAIVERRVLSQPHYFYKELIFN
jgi:type I site-specific restriction endonuclease